MTPAALLTMVGEALFGSRWQTELAIALHVSDRTLRRWIAGTDVPRVDVVKDLSRLLKAHHEILEMAEQACSNIPLVQFRAAGSKVA